MRISPERLESEAESTGFKADVLEKAALLLGVLDAICNHPALKGKLALKGGTALNLFVFQVPRLSVDIDLNYVGAWSREEMLEERPKIEKAIQEVFSREDFTVRRIPGEHAGGKWSLRYPSALGQSGRLDVDINFMYRVPLWPIDIMDSRFLGAWKVNNIPVMELHELTAGKLAALLSRRRARDLFDSCQIFSMENLDFKRLRTAFVVYGAMHRRDWRTVSIEDVDFDVREINSQLVPLLNLATTQHSKETGDYGNMLVEKCRQGLEALLPFNDAEQAFLDLLLEKGEIDARILTSDTSLQERIQAQPLLQWKALNVQLHKRLSGGSQPGLRPIPRRRFDYDQN